MKAKFFKCPMCGNVIAMCVDSGVVPVCCGKPMIQLNPKAQDGALEKHVPVVTRSADGSLLVEVGAVPHPMLEEHHIAFVAVETEKSLTIIDVYPGTVAQVVHHDCDDKVLAVYEYCNLHGLWMTTDIPTK